MSPRSKLFLAQCVGSAAFITFAASAALPADPRFAPLSEWDIGALERARAGAVRRLQEPECQKVLSDFTDPEGRTLLANLEPWQQSASDYLRQAITFRDGSSIRDCRKRSVLLVTSRGLPSVFVCPAGGSTPGGRFAKAQIETPALAEAMIIHEMLHTLGLGENPPTTFEITERVMARCR